MLVYSPLVVNQEANRPLAGKRKEVWSIVLNASEVRAIPRHAIVGGDALPFKIAMWGLWRDEHLLRTMEKHERFSCLGSYAGTPRPNGIRKHGDPICVMAEGPALRLLKSQKQLRTENGDDENGDDDENDDDDDGEEDNERKFEKLEPLSDVAGKPYIDRSFLKGRGRLYKLPREALTQKVPDECAYVRRGRGKVTLSVCKPPHIIVSETRTFAVFSNEFVVVPNNSPGIAGPPSERNRLIAISLYLSSDFANYYDFFRSPNGGITGRRSTLRALKALPCPLIDATETSINEWVELHRDLVNASSRTSRKASKQTSFLAEDDDDPELEELEAQLNAKVGDILGFTETERSLVSDLVNVRQHLVDGVMDAKSVRLPQDPELKEYAKVLQEHLNDYLPKGSGLIHKITIVRQKRCAMVQIEIVARQPKSIAVLVASGSAEKALADLMATNGQWLYFDRNLFVYNSDSVFILKPMQFLHWTKTQGMLDASGVIAHSVTKGSR